MNFRIRKVNEMDLNSEIMKYSHSLYRDLHKQSDEQTLNYLCLVLGPYFVTLLVIITLRQIIAGKYFLVN